MKNSLSGEVPKALFNTSSLTAICLQQNQLVGSIPPVTAISPPVKHLYLGDNHLSGSIPLSIGKLSSLVSIHLNRNKLVGGIPECLGNISTLEILDFNENNLSGPGNKYLCTSVPAGGMPLCSAFTDRKRKHKILALVLEIVISVAAAVMIFSCLTAIHWRKRMQVKSNMPKLSQHNETITYRDIVNATERFSSFNLIGSGSFGVVYKGNLHGHEDQVAIKIFKLDIYGADKNFAAECEALRNLRHRNLVKIITLCSSVDYTGSAFKALVFQYMPNGNLDSWLHLMAHEHSQRDTLTLRQRINISLGVASALDYIHNHCATPLIHCDLKPSNVLLDLNFTPCVSDFGLARFLYSRNTQQDCTSTMACPKGSIGYIPPEYGMKKKISTKGDVYSFGILLLEMITGRRPTDEKVCDGTNLHGFVERAFPEKIPEIANPTMLQDEIDAAEAMKNYVIPLVRIGLSCSMTSPKERPEMVRVYTEILTIKQKFSGTTGK
ncbi:hypothetical protein HU200_064950 [Digitaria exilis]|uniref:Receptor kinase-like protein Xa21 n=1 Tax=Digitaria exilis TaxID=1010633 RepID=A0A835DU70_9POAL|nr:hypothetical protein HU200_064950 [Digitaria exilis]